MSTLRYDPAQRRSPLGVGHRRVSHRGPRTERGRWERPVEAEVVRWGDRETAEAAVEIGSFMSVVLPARNEAPGLKRLVDEILWALRPLCRDEGPRRLSGFEIIVVDDGSTDGTSAILRALAEERPELRGLILKERAGQSSAVWAGVRAARGEWVATLDADSQNDPADLAALWAALPGHDVALGFRASRRDTWSRRLIGRCANWTRNRLLGQSIRDTGCSVRIFPRALALRLPAFQGAHRFFGPMFLREGCRLVQVPVGHRPRAHGRSHYNLWNRSLRVVVDLFGAAWLMRRPLLYQVSTEWRGGRERERECEPGAGRPAAAAAGRVERTAVPLWKEERCRARHSG